MYTLLHISDLHRSPEEPITNDTLLASLVADRDRLATETPSVSTPDAIIVSGDIIQGARLGAAGSDDAIRKQYSVASDFLARLVNRFLGGDRRRIVLVPGNHDVCWNTAKAAMRSIKREHEPDDIPAVFANPEGPHRWSWDERQTYEVFDGNRYQARLDAYWSFVESFYSGAPLTLPIDRSRGFNLFELAGGQIVVAAFASVHGNDCFSLVGALEPGIVSRCGLMLRDRRNRCPLRIAVWHHSLHGPPARSDYMDLEAVYEMIGNGFRLGLHGHQHLAEARAHYIHLPDEQAMAVVSAGSLCAGSQDLPRGVDRQYNVIAIRDDFLAARVHVREMREGSQFGRYSRGAFAVDGSLSLQWSAPANAVGGSIDVVALHKRTVVFEAEEKLKGGYGSEALTLLLTLDTTQSAYARALTVEAARQVRRWDVVRQVLSDPANADELVQLVEASLAERDAGKAIAALTKHADALGLAQPLRDSLGDRAEALALLKKGTS